MFISFNSLILFSSFDFLLKLLYNKYRKSKERKWYIMNLKKCLQICLMRCIIGIILNSISVLSFLLVGLLIKAPVECAIFGLIVGALVTGCAWADIK